MLCILAGILAIVPLIITNHHILQLVIDESIGCPHTIFVAATVVSLVELPVMEKLQLSGLMGTSMEEQGESLDEDELQWFMELKHKMILLEKAELGSVAQGDGNTKSCLHPITHLLVIG